MGGDRPYVTAEPAAKSPLTKSSTDRPRACLSDTLNSCQDVGSLRKAKRMIVQPVKLAVMLYW